MENQGLLTTKVARALEMKTKLFGFELPDLLLIFMNLAVTNLVFGSTSVRYLLVWGTTLMWASFLFFSKRGKPDSYLQHYGELIAQSSHKAAGRADIKYRRFKQNSQRKESVNENKK